MHTTELITHPDSSDAVVPRSHVLVDAHLGLEPPTDGEILGEVGPLVGVVPVAGPPVVLLAGPVVLLALLLAGPFAVLLTLVVLLVAVIAVVALIAAVVASPFVLVDRLRGRRAAARAYSSAPAPQLVRAESPRGAA
jgi:hypothetical protein